jgi:hypothetical protein
MSRYEGMQIGSMSDVARRVGVSFARIGNLVRLGYVIPEGDIGTRGAPSRFTDRDVDVFLAVERALRLRSPGSQRCFRALGDHVREHGLTGTFELVPGVTVDIAGLVDTP